MLEWTITNSVNEVNIEENHERNNKVLKPVSEESHNVTDNQKDRN